MNRPVGVCITQNSRNPRIFSAYKLYAFYYFYIVVLSVSVCQQQKHVQIMKKKYIMTNIDTQETDYSVYVYSRCKTKLWTFEHTYYCLTTYDINWLDIFYRPPGNYSQDTLETLSSMVVQDGMYYLYVPHCHVWY
jgi:hypothetical protein